MFSVCVLTFGDQHRLFRRCLGSIVKAMDKHVVAELRIGLNDVTAAVDSVLHGFMAELSVPVTTYRTTNNCGKYQLMRRMLDQPALCGHRVMWFDDDSFIRNDRSGWFSLVQKVSDDADLLGSVYTIRLPELFTESQRQRVTEQPWYTGKPVDGKYVPSFCTGGWWVAREDFLKKWSYPFPELYHNGGDVVLGELCRQQGAVMRHFNSGVAINADEGGRESRGRRRGLRTKPWGQTDHVPADVVVHVERLQ